MNDEKHKFIYELLKTIFNNVNNWLTFAEAKNAAIIVFNIGFLSFLFNVDYFEKLNWFLISISVLFIISTMIALWSFIPQMGKNISSNNCSSGSDNLLFYGDIIKYDVNSYLKLVFKKYMNVDISDNDIDKIENDLAEEIIYNSIITVRKYELFTKAVKVDMFICILISLLFLFS